jgi:hypothetical protein
VSTTVLTPETHLPYRPLSVLEPFADAKPVRYALARMAADQRFCARAGRLSAIHCAERTAILDGSARLAYDMLPLATGALTGGTVRERPGIRARTPRHRIGARSGGREDVRRVAFVVPAGCNWPLAPYELADVRASRVRCSASILRST